MPPSPTAPPPNANAPAVPFVAPTETRPALSKDSPLVMAFNKNLAEAREAQAAKSDTKIVLEPKSEFRPKPEVKVDPAKPAVEVKAPAADEFEAPQSLSDPAKVSWQRLRDSRLAKETEAKAAKAEAEALKTQLAELMAKNKALGEAVSPEEFKRLKGERDAFEATVIQLNVEQHPQFQAYFAKEIGKVEASLKNALGEQAAEVMKILAQPDGDAKTGQILDLMADMDGLKQNRLAIAVNRMQEIAAERAGELAKSRENLTKATEQRKVAQAQAQTQARAANEKLFTDTLARFTDPKEGLPEFIAQEGDEKSAAVVKANTDAVRRLVLGNNSPEELVTASFFAVRGAQATVLLKAAAGEIEKLQKQVAELSGAQPKAPAVAGAGADADPGAGQTWAQKAASLIASLPGRRE